MDPLQWMDIAFFSKKVVLSESGGKYARIKHCLQAKTVQNKYIGGCLWIIVMFLSAVWTLILTAPIHCRGSIGEQVM